MRRKKKEIKSYKCFKLESWVQFSGIEPLNLLFARFRVCRCTRSPRKSGSKPDRSLFCKSLQNYVYIIDHHPLHIINLYTTTTLKSDEVQPHHIYNNIKIYLQVNQKLQFGNRRWKSSWKPLWSQVPVNLIHSQFEVIFAIITEKLKLWIES